MKVTIEDVDLQALESFVPLFSGSAGSDPGAWVVGKKYLVRTVTMYVCGLLARVTPLELIFTDAAWIPDCGQYHDALKNGELSEVEPVEGDYIVGRLAIVDAAEWRHELPRSVK